MSLKRLLYLDGFDEAIQDLQVLTSLESVASLYNLYFSLKMPIDLALDGRLLSDVALSKLLKFIEEYKGSIVLVLNDRGGVVDTLMSRFNDVRVLNRVKPKSESMVLRGQLQGLGMGVRKKLCDFFGLSE
jgi:hypothetical protein